MRAIDADALKDEMRGIFIDFIEEDLAVEKIDTAPTIDTPQWISVEERLPKFQDHVLITTTKGEVEEALRITNGYVSEFWYNDYDVIAWMPLPPSYERNERSE